MLRFLGLLAPLFITYLLSASVSAEPALSQSELHQSKQSLSGIAQPGLAQPGAAKPIVIAHRGASGYLPEHTTEAVVMAYMQNADYIEQDLVLTKDGHLVVLHDIHIDTTTDVAQKFPERIREDNRYYAIDFSLRELKQLTVFERRNGQNQQVFASRFQGTAGFQIATFDEHISLIQQLNRQFNKEIGWYIEIKSPQWHLDQGQDIAKLLVEALSRYGLNNRESKVFVQCFDFKHSKRLRQELHLKTSLVQLLAENDWGESATDYDFLKTEQGLMEIATVADGIGPWIPQLLELKGGTVKRTGLTLLAKKHDLLVHPYTFRKDALPEGVSYQQLLYMLFTELKVDGVFTDFTDTVVNYLKEHSQGKTH